MDSTAIQRKSSQSGTNSLHSERRGQTDVLDVGASKTLLVVKSGMEFCVLKSETIAYFYTEKSVVYGVDRDGKNYIVESKKISDLVERLNEKIFYNVNLKYIININYIKKFRAHLRTKIHVELTLPTSDDIVISQENTKKFKDWINSL